MADDRERDRAFRAERRRQQRRLTAIQRDTAGEVARILREAETRISARLAGPASEFQAFLLPEARNAVRAALGTFERDGGAAVQQGVGRAWLAGVDMLDRPVEAGLAAGGGPQVRLSAILPSIDTRQLEAMKTFLTGRMRDVTVKLADRINAELGLVLAGAQGPGEAASAISQILRSGGAQGGRRRVITIVRTELGRAHAAAGQARYSQAATVLPGLKKQWRRSGKIHARIDHVAADGQVREVDEPYRVGGVALMYPRDPDAPAAATVNCGCSSLPYMEHWDMRQPGRQPFSRQEVALSPAKRALEQALDAVPVPPAATSPELAALLAGRRAAPVPVARLPGGLAQAIGARTATVSVSRPTVVKQAKHREVTQAAYGQVQAMIDRGEAIRDRNGDLVLVTRDAGGRLWEAAIKRTGEGGELFLTSLHRSREQRRRSLRRRGEILRVEEQ
ncbi:MAG: hypothetical protein AB7N54_19940 [Alphaproteobacteria bacterium]